MRSTRWAAAGAAAIAVTLLAAAVTLTLAGLSWRFFEQPIIERGHAHRYKLPPAPDPGASQA